MEVLGAASHSVYHTMIRTTTMPNLPGPFYSLLTIFDPSGSASIQLSDRQYMALDAPAATFDPSSRQLTDITFAAASHFAMLLQSL